MLLIGLGKTGSLIATKFSSNRAYKIIVVNNDPVTVPADVEYFKVAKQSNSEEYESLTNLAEVEQFSDKCEEQEVCLILSSAGAISGLSLRILEIFKNRECSVLLIRPEGLVLNGVKKTQDRITFGILQEYARSGLLKELFVVDNQSIEELFGKLPVYSYFLKINEAIYQTFHMMQVMRHNESVMQTSQDISNIARICTFGLCDFENNQENLFTKLNNTKHKQYFFLVPKKQLEEDENLLDSIRNFVNNRTDSDIIDVGFKIFESVSDKFYCMCTAYSSSVQDVAAL